MRRFSPAFQHPLHSQSQADIPLGILALAFSHVNKSKRIAAYRLQMQVAPLGVQAPPSRSPVPSRKMAISARAWRQVDKYTYSCSGDKTKSLSFCSCSSVIFGTLAIRSSSRATCRHRQSVRSRPLTREGERPAFRDLTNFSTSSGVIASSSAPASGS